MTTPAANPEIDLERIDADPKKAERSKIVDDANESQQSQPRTKWSKKKLLLIAFFALLLIGGLAAGLVMYFRRRWKLCFDKRPCAAELLGDVGRTTVAGIDKFASAEFRNGNKANSNGEYEIEKNHVIYGPFEAGFTTRQDSVLRNLGCTQWKLDKWLEENRNQPGWSNTNEYVPGGIDTQLAQKMVWFKCGIELPRWDLNAQSGEYEYVGFLAHCGEHAQPVHFHERFGCLYQEKGGHSWAVGEEHGNVDGSSETHPRKLLYGKWEDYATKELPKNLDACGWHFGKTPDSPEQEVYHYHVQEHPPFSFGCYGPDYLMKEIDPPEQDLSSPIPVSVERCMALYPDRCSYGQDGEGDDNKYIEIEIAEGIFKYNQWCPCFVSSGEGTGSVVNIVEQGQVNFQYQIPRANWTIPVRPGAL